METLKPKFSEVSNDLNVETKKLSDNIKIAITNALPIGFVISVDKNTMSIGRTSGFYGVKCPNGISFINPKDQLVLEYFGNEFVSCGLIVKPNITPIEFYQLSEVLQIVIGVDLNLIKYFEVSK